MKKIIISIAVILILSVFSTATVLAEEIKGTYYEEASSLASLGLFKGGTSGYELDRTPTRLESGIMLIRLLGKENEALNGNWTHTFKDVPSWGDKYVGYLYEKGLTKGISSTNFGSSNLTDAKSYTTFVLRALGYNDAKGDFQWNDALDKAVSENIITQQEAETMGYNTFLRDQMVHISYLSLFAELNGSQTLLKEKLSSEGAIPSGLIFSKTDLLGDFGVGGFGIGFESGYTSDDPINPDAKPVRFASQVSRTEQKYEVYISKGGTPLNEGFNPIDLKIDFELHQKLSSDTFSLELTSAIGESLGTAIFKLSGTGDYMSKPTYIYKWHTNSVEINEMIPFDQEGYFTFKGIVNAENGLTRELSGKIAVVDDTDPRITEEMYYEQK